MKKYIGIDLGGTNIRVALVDDLGNILDQRDAMTEIEKGADQVIEKIVSMSKSLDMSDVEAIGIGLPGPVGDETRVLVLASNLPGFENLPIIDRIESELHLPTFLINDGNAAGLAEATVGAGKEFKNCVYITISTGIGSAIVLDGKVHGGTRGYAGEVGNIMLDRSKDRINNLAPGAAESYASGTALVRQARSIPSLSHVQHAGDIFDLAQTNEDAKQLCDAFVLDVAQMLGAIAHVVDPDVFIFGGGVMKSKDYFFDQLYETFKSYVHPEMRAIIFREASLEEPGVLGAAMQAKNKLNNREE